MAIALWGGRFSGGPADALTELSRSTQFDWRLAQVDIAGSKAHSTALHKAGLLSDEELSTMHRGLDSLLQRVLDGSFTPDPGDEDVHTALERGLLETIGPDIGGKLRAGRSRNDQIATEVLMYLRHEARHLTNLLLDVADAILSQADRAGEAIMPGRTHLQHAQPVLVAHHLLAHAWPIVRTVNRLQDWDKRAAISPYGSGALAGNTLGMDPQAIAHDLGFATSCENSIDGTASRDVVAEFACIIAIAATSISRMCEEIIIWNTKEFNYVTLDDAFSTGSSIMPQKKNPDVAELGRGKTGRLISAAVSILTMLKGIPLAYDRDMQEDKEPIFDQIDTLDVLLPAIAGMVQTMSLNLVRMEELAPQGFSLATDIAEWLVKQGVPFREAHEIAGACVQECEGRGIELADLTDDDFARIDARLTPQVRSVLTIQGSVAARNAKGGTAPAQVHQQKQNLSEQLAQLRVWAASL